MLHTPPALSDLSRSLLSSIESALAEYTRYPEGCPQSLGDAIRHSLLAPGKRLRPLLTLFAAQACGSSWQSALPAACAVEMVHTYSLIHDDLPAMDDDSLRRGRPTCHVVYGQATAILAGDALLAQAFEVIATGIVPGATAALCCGELARAAGPTALVGGQADDLAAEFSHGGLDQLESIHRRKTGAIFLAALRMGGLVAQASPDQFAALDCYGRNLGLAFQIVDDLLDHCGDAAVVGKKTGKDQQRGKLTFPAVLGEESSRDRSRELIAAASEALSPLGERAAGLHSLARFVLERNR